MKQLTKKQAAFAQHVALHGSATEAYKAVYSTSRMKPESIHVAASQLATNDKVAIRIRELSNQVKKQSEEQFAVDAAWVLRRYIAIANANPKDYYRWDNGKVTLKSSDEMTEDQLLAISHVQQKRGKDQTIEVRLADRMKALDALARHVNLFDKDNELASPKIELGSIADLLDAVATKKATT